MSTEPIEEDELPRKIVHIDMDCFYAAIEVRDHPELQGKPVAVGGRSGRGVLTTCNYEAREYGCRSAMPGFKARELCPHLIVMPVRFDVYRAVSREVRDIFAQFTELIEPLSLDEAFLDVSHLNSSAASIAEEVRFRIREKTRITASAGIAPNKMLAKIASDWNKPDGQFEVRPQDVEAFMLELPVKKIWGVGPRSVERLEKLGIKSCGDVQKWSLTDLHRHMGNFGIELYNRSRGIDHREVNPDRERKSVSNESTYAENLRSLDTCVEKLDGLYEELIEDVKSKHSDRRIQKAFVKMKFADFKQTTVERAMDSFDPHLYRTLIAEAWERGQGREVRLLGAGVRFVPLDRNEGGEQLDFFD